MKMFILLGCLFLPLNPVFATTLEGDGSGVNGPELAGSAIPLKLDRVATLKSVLEATNICYFEGDASRGLTSLADKLQFLIWGMNDFNRYYDRITYDPLLDPGFERSRLKDLFLAKVRGGRIGFGEEYDMFHLLVEMHLVPASGSSPDDFPTYGKLIVRKDGKTADIQLNDTLPLVVWSEDEQYCESYDELGSCDPIAVVKNLRVQPGKRHGTSVTLYNIKTGAPTALKINTEEIAQCLADEVRRLNK